MSLKLRPDYANSQMGFVKILWVFAYFSVNIVNIVIWRVASLVCEELRGFCLFFVFSMTVNNQAW